MKIVHLSLEAPYNEGWGYQENILPKYQVKAGHDVTLVITNMENCEGGGQKEVPTSDYISPDGFRVIRLDYIHYKPAKLAFVFKYYKIYDLLKETKPDFIMVHGLKSFSVIQVVRYLKKVNPSCKVVADNHSDCYNGGYLLKDKLSTKLFVKAVRTLNKRVQKYYTKVFGVTPLRCNFARDVFGIKEDKLDLLPAGADDEKIDYNNKEKVREQIREKHNIDVDDFLIVTGGKIDNEKNIDKLMEAVTEISNDSIKLLVFGKCSDDVKEKVERLAEHKAIRYIGWIDSEETYDYFIASDLVFFPGSHSVMWEQAVACGVPCVFKHYDFMHHCDVGGNCKFLYDDSLEGIKNLIEEIIDPQIYCEMLKIAESDLKKQFLYSQLAEKIII